MIWLRDLYLSSNGCRHLLVACIHQYWKLDQTWRRYSLKPNIFSITFDYRKVLVFFWGISLGSVPDVIHRTKKLADNDEGHFNFCVATCHCISLAAPDPQKRVWWNCVEKVWHCRNLRSPNQIAPFQIWWCHTGLSKESRLVLISYFRQVQC